MSANAPPRTSANRTTARDGRRAQTTMDFVVGISLFLLVVVFVVAFVPGIFDPFDGTDRTQTADRLGAALANDALGDPASPAALNATCTWSFFEQMNGTDAAADCEFDAATDTVASTLGTTRAVNVTVFDGDAVVKLDGPDGNTTRELRAGPVVPDHRAVSTARRVVLLDGRTYQLVVRVW